MGFLTPWFGLSDNSAREAERGEPKELGDEVEKGRKLLISFLTENREMERYELFRRAWHLILENQNHFRAINETANRYWQFRFNVSWQSRIYKELLILFREVVTPSFVPLVRGVGPDFIADGDRGALYMTIHSNLELGAIKLVQEQGHSVSAVAARLEPISFRRLFRLSEPVEIIWLRNDSLLQIRRALKAFRSVLVNVDYALFDRERQLYVKRANRTFLEAAVRFGVSIYWILPFIGPDGEVVCCSKRIASETTPQEKLQLLNSLAKQHGYGLGELTLGDWSKEKEKGYTASSNSGENDLISDS